MFSLTIDNVDDQLKTMLNVQAARHGCTVEEEILDILRRAVEEQSSGIGFAQKISRRFAEMNADDLPVPARGMARVSVLMKE